MAEGIAVAGGYEQTGRHEAFRQTPDREIEGVEFLAGCNAADEIRRGG